MEPPAPATKRELVRISRQLEQVARTTRPLAAADLSGVDVDDDARSFRYAVTRDPEVVAACARALGI